MTLTFLGTRGYIDLRTRRHGRHSALLVTHRGRRVMIDCGEDWLGRLGRIRPDAIVVTHAHPDHAGGLARGVPCPVYATARTWTLLGRVDVAPHARRLVRARTPTTIAGLDVEAFPVEHSLRAPAVGYRVAANGVAFVYVPDVLSIPARRAALASIDLYVGDGASIVRPIVRRRDGVPFGHAPIAAQVAWCGAEGVPRAIFTHCGTGIVGGDAREAAARVLALGRAHGVATSIAHDGQALVLRRSRPRRASGPPSPNLVRPGAECEEGATCTRRLRSSRTRTTSRRPGSPAAKHARAWRGTGPTRSRPIASGG